MDKIRENAEKYFEEEISGEPLYQDLVIDWLTEFAKQQVSVAELIDVSPDVFLLERVNRIEVIDQNGRSYVNWKPTNKTELSIQDEGRTLKVFING